MFYAKYSLYGAEHSELYHDFETYNKQTYSPLVKDIVFIDFTIHGKDYKSRKQSLYCIAVEWSNSDPSGLSIDELCDIDDWFLRMGKRYGLTQEFRENCIIY